MKKEKITIELPTRMVVLTIEPFDMDIDMDDLTSIHYHNIMGEIITSSVLLNRAGNLLGEINEVLSKANLDYDIFYAQQYAKYKKQLVHHVITSRSEKFVPPTDTEVEQAIFRMSEYKTKKTNIITVRKNKDIVESLYWSVQDKCKKLQSISDKMRPEEFEKDIVEEKINGIMIRIHKKAIQ